jgi:hypothetical protein
MPAEIEQALENEDEILDPDEPTGEKAESSEAAPAAGGKSGVDGKEATAQGDKSYLKEIPDERFDEVIAERNDLRTTTSELLQQNRELMDLLKESKGVPSEPVEKAKEEAPEFFSDTEKQLYGLVQGLKSELETLKGDQAKSVEQRNRELIADTVETHKTEADRLATEAGITLSGEDRLKLIQETALLGDVEIGKATRMTFRELFGDRKPDPDAAKAAAAKAAAAKAKLTSVEGASRSSAASAERPGHLDLREAMAAAHKDIGE